MMVQIILVSQRLSKARTIDVRWGHVLAAGALAMLGMVAASAFLSYFGVRHAAEIKLPLLQSILRSATEAETARYEAFVQENLNAMAVKLGQMQAQLTRLDALGERLSATAGIKPGELRFDQLPGRGGALPTLAPPRNLSLMELGRQLEAVSQDMESRTDYLAVLERELLDARVRQNFQPTTLPVTIGSWNASGFGWRIDPITGQSMLHEGIDFIAPPGSPIAAAASGVVIAAEYHPTYGYMLDIDHGNDLVSRYAHASRLLVRQGDVVKRGQRIAEVGNTGRSTGAHLHFEVRVKGVAQNPARFLQAAR